MSAGYSDATRLVACIDIGSNTIKLLIARGGPGGSPEAVDEVTLPVRLGAGISHEGYELAAEGMEQAVQAVQALADRARMREAEPIIATATSAVRDASNGTEFRDRIAAGAGLSVRVLDGDEEARYIARGVASDPTLPATPRCTLVDIGGGSMELVRIVNREPDVRISLPLGAVRLTERFVSDPTQPIGGSTLRAIAEEARNVLGSCGFPWARPAEPVVGTGGAVTWARVLLGHDRGLTTAGGANPRLPADELRDLLNTLAALPQHEREARFSLPPQRADILPAALVVLTACLEHTGAPALHHSFYNLRFGVCAELLEHAAEIRR